MQLKIAKPSTEAEKTTGTTLDCVEITPAIAKSWRLPPFQRPLRVNDKVTLLATKIKADDGVIPGILTLGVIKGERFLVDGQHRREAFLLSECLVGYVDVRVLHFADMAEMGEEFVNINSQLVKMRPDDIIRGLEGTYETIAKIRRRCPFVGYDQVRRGNAGDKAIVLGMSQVLRCWVASSHEVPAGGGESAAGIVRSLSMEEADLLIKFLDCAITAWGRDPSNFRLWSGLNLAICMWLYRRLVVSPYSSKTERMTAELFTKCLMSVSATGTYVDWLLGRNLKSRDLSPAYGKLKAIFQSRVEVETGKKPLLPAPAWSSSKTGAR